MKYFIVSPKYSYYFTLVIFVCGVASFAYMLPTIIQIEQEITTYIIVLLSAGAFIWFVFGLLNRMIYAKIDPGGKTIIYGSIFFLRKAPLAQIEEIKKSTWSGSTYRITIDSKKYIFMAHNLNMKVVRDIIFSVNTYKSEAEM